MDNEVLHAETRMSGYLNKKGKLRMVSTWKRYWFVLKGRLLLYYRNKEEYEAAISPCKGSINLGPPCTVKLYPSIEHVFQIETRTNTFTFKAANSVEQKKWMQAIMSALNQNQNFSHENLTKLYHFRYSLDNLIPEHEPCDIPKKFERQNTMPHKIKTTKHDNSDIIKRLQKIGAHSYGGSLGAISKITSKSSNNNNNNNNNNSEVNNSVNFREKCKSSNIYERISGDSSDNSRKSDFIVDNENYSIPLKRASYCCERSFLVNNNIFDDSDTIVENNQYCSVKIPHGISEAIYAEPRITRHRDEEVEEEEEEITDFNRNSVVVENSFYANAANSMRKTTDENIYEDLENCRIKRRNSNVNHYSEPIFRTRSAEIPSHDNSSCTSSSKNKLNFRDKIGSILNAKSSNDSTKPKDKSLKKSKSFIRRVWKKRKNHKSQESEDIYEELPFAPVEKTDMTDESAVQLLNELQNILETKKAMLEKTFSDASASSRKSSELAEGEEKRASTPNSEMPQLPPKTHKQQPPFPRYSDSTKTIDQEQVRSLDEILEDLDRETIEPKNNVKRLIEKFSEPESGDDVVLRKHLKPDFRINRYSDELNRLLDELAKVTSAPILTPGVTSSLVNPNLSKEEWLQLLPIRQRRLSEPDYDVPRSHKSLQYIPKNDKCDIIPATRFFGPALAPNSNNLETRDDSIEISMTPDSLEIDENKVSQTNYSYTSHTCNYYKNDSQDFKCFTHNQQNDENVIYALPKPYLSVATHIVNTCQNICTSQISDEHTIIYENVKNIDIPDEIFKDSLELSNCESLTEF